MAHSAPARRPAAARRTGYLVAVIINGALLFIINASPGWQAAPFLTQATREVLGLVNLVLALNVAANLIYLAYDGRWIRSIGDIVIAAVSIAAAVRIWHVFPFDFGTATGWSVLVRVLLIVGIVGSAIGILARLVWLARGVPAR